MPAWLCVDPRAERDRPPSTRGTFGCREDWAPTSTQCTRELFWWSSTIFKSAFVVFFFKIQSQKKTNQRKCACSTLVRRPRPWSWRRVSRIWRATSHRQRPRTTPCDRAPVEWTWARRRAVLTLAQTSCPHHYHSRRLPVVYYYWWPTVLQRLPADRSRCRPRSDRQRASGRRTRLCRSACRWRSAWRAPASRVAADWRAARRSRESRIPASAGRSDSSSSPASHHLSNIGISIRETYGMYLCCFRISNKIPGLNWAEHKNSHMLSIVLLMLMLFLFFYCKCVSSSRRQ